MWARKPFKSPTSKNISLWDDDSEVKSGQVFATKVECQKSTFYLEQLDCYSIGQRRDKLLHVV